MEIEPAVSIPIRGFLVSHEHTLDYHQLMSSFAAVKAAA